MVIAIGARSERRIGKRLRAIRDGHPCERRPIVVFKTVGDLAREADLTAEQRELYDAHLARHLAEAR